MSNDIILELLFVSMAASVISTQLIQKIKSLFNFGKVFNNIVSIFISIGIGFIYSYSFYSHNILYSIWISLFTLIGAESIYKMFNNKYGIDSISKEKKKE